MRELRDAIAEGAYAEHGERVLGGARRPVTHAPFWLDEPYEPRPPLRGRRRGRGLRDRRGRGRPLLRAAAGPARHRDARARARHGRRRRQRAQRRLPARRDGRLPRRRPRALRAPSGPARALRAHARRRRRRSTRWPTELGAGDAVRRTGLLRVSASEEEAEHVRRQVDALREDGFPGELLERDELPAGAARELLERLPDRARRRPASGALDPRAGAGRRAGRRAHPRGQPGRAARSTRARGRAHRRGHACARATWSWPPTARCPRLVPELRAAGARAAAAHGRHRAAGRAAGRPPGLRALGLRVLPAAAGRPHAGGRLQRPRRRGLLHRPRRGQPARLGPHRALPARRPRRGGAGHAPLGRDRGLQRGRPARSSARCRAARACTRPAATRATATCSATWPASSWPT